MIIIKTRKENSEMELLDKDMRIDDVDDELVFEGLSIFKEIDLCRLDGVYLGRGIGFLSVI